MIKYGRYYNSADWEVELLLYVALKASLFLINCLEITKVIQMYIEIFG